MSTWFSLNAGFSKEKLAVSTSPLLILHMKNVNPSTKLYKNIDLIYWCGTSLSRCFPIALLGALPMGNSHSWFLVCTDDIVYVKKIEIRLDNSISG
jgi:hypothetical protein